METTNQPDRRRNRKRRERRRRSPEEEAGEEESTAGLETHVDSSADPGAARDAAPVAVETTQQTQDTQELQGAQRVAQSEASSAAPASGKKEKKDKEKAEDGSVTRAVKNTAAVGGGVAMVPFSIGLWLMGTWVGKLFKKHFEGWDPFNISGFYDEPPKKKGK